MRFVDAIAAPHDRSIEKHSFADKCVPKCNLGTRGKPTHDLYDDSYAVWVDAYNGKIIGSMGWL